MTDDSDSAIADVTGVRALAVILRGTFPTLIALALMLGAVAVWQYRDPIGFPLRGQGVDREIIGTQIDRAQRLPLDIDLLLIGDSSGLMGIDAPQLSAALGGASVESLNTLGFVGPRGYAAILNRFIDRGGHAARLLIVLESSSLARKPQWKRYEIMATDGITIPAPPNGLWAGIRARLLALAEPMLYVPLFGHFGDYYATSPMLAAYIRAHHGTAVEPGPPRPVNEPRRGGVKPYRERAAVRFAMNDEFLDGLPALAESLARFGRDKVRIVLMPQMSWFDEADTERRRQATFDRLRDALHLDASAQLQLPVLLPAFWYSSESHLSRFGRKDFTEILARSLSEDRAHSPWTR